LATEILSVPEEHLQEVIDIIRAGLHKKKDVTPEVFERLIEWCDEEEQYLKG